MAGFAAAGTVIATLIWLFCAGMTIWKGLLTGEMFLTSTGNRSARTRSPGQDDIESRKRRVEQKDKDSQNMSDEAVNGSASNVKDEQADSGEG